MSSTASKAFAFAVLLAVAGAGHAADAAPAAQDPVLEQRVNALAAELRCLVCQNQTIADSSAGLAIDLKNEIRDKLGRGESEAQVVEFMVARYGDFVLYRPPVKASTLLLWTGPLLLLVIGLFVLYRRLRRLPDTAGADLTSAERARAADLLASEPKEHSR